MPDRAGLQAELDQFGATCRDFAPVVGLYYRSLIEAGIPEERAAELVEDWHYQWWEQLLGKGLNDAH